MSARKALGALVMAVALLGAAMGPGIGATNTAANTGIAVDDTVTGSPDGAVEAAANGTFTVSVWVNASDVSGYQTNLTFDPNVVQVADVSGTDDYAAPISNVDNQNGWVAFNQLRDSGADDPVLVTMTFDVVGSEGDATTLSFVESETTLSDSDGTTSSPAEFTATELSVTAPAENETETPTENETATENDTSAPSENETETPTENETETPTENETATENETSAPSENETVTPTPTPTPTATPTATPTPTPTEAESNSGGSSSSSGGGGGGGGGGDAVDREPSFRVKSTQVDSTSVANGWNVTVTSTVKNGGNGEGYYRAELFVDGSQNGETQFVFIPAGETREIQMSEEFDSNGTYSIAMSEGEAQNVSLGTTQVASDSSTPEPDSDADPGTPTASPTQSETATPSSADDASGASDTPVNSDVDVAVGSGPGFTVVTVLVAIGLLTVALWTRRS